MVTGVSEGFEKILEISGVGYRAQKPGDKLLLQVGYANTVELLPPPGIGITVEGTNRIRVSGIDKELVGETAAKIRAIRPPDSYKGKGIKYLDEKLRLKPGKSGKVGKK
jgi:large subunit ribosomal protein L6